MAGRGIHEGRIVGHQPEVFRAGLDLTKVHGTDGATEDRYCVALLGPIVCNSQGLVIHLEYPPEFHQIQDLPCTATSIVWCRIIRQLVGKLGVFRRIAARSRGFFTQGWVWETHRCAHEILPARRRRREGRHLSAEYEPLPEGEVQEGADGDGDAIGHDRTLASMARKPSSVRWSELTHEGMRWASQTRTFFSARARMLSCFRSASWNVCSAMTRRSQEAASPTARAGDTIVRSSSSTLGTSGPAAGGSRAHGRYAGRRRRLARRGSGSA